MSSFSSIKRELVAAPQSSNHLVQILGGGAVLALLYLGRDVLIPFTLAILLSLVMVPFVRRLQSLGIGRTASTWVAVFAVTGTLLAIGALIAFQVVRVRSNLPHYEEALRGKLAGLHGIAVGTMMPVGVQLFSRIRSWIWPTVETAGIVLFVLVPVLLERDVLRSLCARLLGATEVPLATAAINDAGEKLSRFFLLQLAIHLLVGVVILAGLAALGLAHATLLAALTVVLRFIPYAGVWIAALCATFFAAVVAPGWSLAIMTLSLFVGVELTVSQLVEVHLYRHATGLSPLAVVVSTVFWSWIWGPVGLFIATPLTLCLVVFGRYIKAFNMFEVLLGDGPVSSLPPRFYRRALSAGTEALIDRARVFWTGQIAGAALRRGDSSRPGSP